MRVRVWNDPYDSEGHGYGGGNCDVANAAAIAKRCAAQGISLMVDFHYSDFWADPGKQMAPKARKDIPVKKRGEVIREWTKEALTEIASTGVHVALVQIGNETNGMFCGEKTWMNIVFRQMKYGCEAVREVCPEAKIAVHFANPENGEQYLTYADKLAYYELDYDVFATSYYPYWHGSLENLKSVLSAIQEKYGKQVMVAETSYAWTLEDGDFSGNTIGDQGGYEKPWPITVQGQANEVRDVAAAVADIGGIGVCYWEGAWVPVGTESWEENSARWEQFGSGWASSYSAEYDPNDAGKYYGGSACDNQTMFDFSGKALPSLQVFRLMREGQETEIRPDAIADTHVVCDLNGVIAFPETVEAVMNDNSRVALPVIWEAPDEATLRSGGPQTYTVRGTAEGMDAVCYLQMIEYNYLLNGGFEDADDSMWRADNFGGTEQLYVEEKLTDSLAGSRHYHFYSAAARSVGFDLEQDAAGLLPGTYRYAISVMGGDAGEQEIYAYVKINGEIIATAPTEITSWNSWHTAVIEGITVGEGDTVTVGLHVVCQGAGAWGKIDEAMLNRQQEAD